jgi:glycosyltransferase involved in cell wall biosynthesis
MKNKIFFFIHSLRHGGAEKVTLEINKYCSDKKLDSKIICWTDYVPYTKDSRYKNTKVISLLKNKKYNWIHSFKLSLKKLNLLIKLEDPDLIHVNSFNCFILLLFSNYKKYIILIIHSYSFLNTKFFSKYIFYRILIIILMKFKKIKIISVSNSLIPIISKFFFISRKKISFIQNSVPDNFFEKDDKSKINQKKIKNIIMLGTLSNHKGQRQGVEIFNKLLKFSSDYRLYIVGSGDEENNIKNYIKKNRLDNKVIITPSTNNIKLYLRKTYIMWLLSKSEGLPLSVMEAMGNGIPCISYNVSGCNEIIKNNINGFLVNYNDENEILKKTIELSADKKKYKNFSKNSKSSIKKDFNFENFLSKHYFYIKNIIGLNEIYRLTAINSIFLNIFPHNFLGDKIFNLIKHIISHKSIFIYKKKINNEILKIKTTNEINDKNRLKTTSKIGTKNYLKKIGLSKYTIPTIKIINNYNELKRYKFNINTIVKTDHASGFVHFIQHKNDYNIEVFKKWLELDYYKVSRELNYKNLKKRLLVENVVFNNINNIDYKFFCYNGVVKFCQLDINRWIFHTRKFYDKKWNDLNFSILYPQSKLNQKKPRLYNEMIYIAEKIAKNFKSIVRVDMFTNNYQIFIGEITHCPGSGTEKFLPKEKEDEISKLLFN